MSDTVLLRMKEGEEKEIKGREKGTQKQARHSKRKVGKTCTQTVQALLRLSMRAL